MSISKRKLKSGAISWGYYFDLPGSTRGDRKTATGKGFATEKAAKQAEAERRVEEARKARMGDVVSTGRPPKRMDELLEEYFQHATGTELYKKTAERYRDLATYLRPELSELAFDEVSGFALTREWKRLKDEGGKRLRKDGSGRPKPLARKTVSGISAMVSSAYNWAMRAGLAKVNPVASSVLPKDSGNKRPPKTLTISEFDLLVKSANYWMLPDFLEVAAATGVRRGELLALRWTDIAGNIIQFAQSLSETKDGLEFKPTKAEKIRVVAVDEATVAILEKHRKQQDELRELHGPDYRTDLDLVFSEPNGEPLSPDAITSLVSRLCRRLKFPQGVSLHTTRHTHASQLLAEGETLTAVSARLGHANTQVTASIYAHVIQGREQKLAETWGRLRGLRVSTGQHHGEKEGQSEERDSTSTIENTRVRPN
jgi:integrase